MSADTHRDGLGNELGNDGVPLHPRSGAPLSLAGEALARCVRNWWLLPTLWVAQLALSAALGRWVGLAVNAAMREHAVLDDGHFLFYVLTLTMEHPAVITTLMVALVTATSISGVANLLLTGGVMRQLDRPTQGGDLVSDGVRLAPLLAVQGLWVGLLRAVLCIPLAIPGAPPWLGAVCLGLVALTTPAHDLVRAEIALEQGAPLRRRLGPRPLIAAVGRAVRRPGFLLGDAALWLVARGCAAGMLYFAMTQAPAHGGAVWGLRLAALVPLALGLLRLALATSAWRRTTRTAA